MEEWNERTSIKILNRSGTISTKVNRTEIIEDTRKNCPEERWKSVNEEKNDERYQNILDHTDHSVDQDVDMNR